MPNTSGMTEPDKVAARDLIRVFGGIGLMSFGGPAAQIALMHRTLVDQERWLNEDTFLRALSLCMLLPGPEAMQLATYAGWRLRGVLGGVIAGVLFVLPGAVVITVLALVYALFGQMPLVQAAFAGIKAAVIIVVLQALLKLSQKALKSSAEWLLAGLAFVALFVFALPFPLIVSMAGLFGALALATVSDGAVAPLPKAGSALRTVGVWGLLWATPVALVWALDHSFLTQIAVFFSQLAVVSFGGAYAVLAYMTQTVVQDYGWISTQQMIDALGLAETTPGPLILVTQFVAMLAGFAQSGIALAMVAGLLCLWVTFIPCFLWIFLAGPYLEVISTMPRISAALRAITAAVVGVILNLAIWFSLHVLFSEIGSVAPLPMPRPVWGSLVPEQLLLTLLAGLLLLVLRLQMLHVLALMALAGLVVGTL